ncbi:MAG TPA: hypothetical protein VN131_05570 [Mobilitalea sp.]|nr:hypothetical protein [Mobilitalea sp.]
MKTYFVDAPVLLFVFVRPDTQTRVFHVEKDSRTRVLSMVCDSPCLDLAVCSNIEESGKIEEDEGHRIAFEDDIIVSVIFFAYFAQLLERYKNDLRNHMIYGNNHPVAYYKTRPDYIFTEVVSVSSFALSPLLHPQSVISDKHEEENMNNSQRSPKKQSVRHGLLVLSTASIIVGLGAVAYALYKKRK